MLHVTFGASAAGSLKMVLERFGRTEPIAFLFDAMDIGPLGGRTEDRMDACAALVKGQWGPAEEVDAFWSEVVAAPSITVWFGRGDACEYTAWLELVHRRSLPIHFLDVADFQDETWYPVRGFATSAQQIVLSLVGRASLLDDVHRQRARARYLRLRAENALLRVVECDELRSVPVGYFDDYLLATTPPEWTPFMQVIGNALGRAIDDPTIVALPGDRFATARLLELVDCDLVEITDDEGKTKIDLRKVRVRRRT